MEKSSQVAWKIVPIRHFFPLKVVTLIDVLLYWRKLATATSQSVYSRGFHNQKGWKGIYQSLD
jgi:hypothetical protein